MQPKAIRSGAIVRGAEGLLHVEMVAEDRECVLDPFAELIWDLCDGSRTIQDLAHAAGQVCNRAVNREEVFSALDFLADAGLLEERVAPPVAEANVSRRSVLARIAPVVGAIMSMSGISAKAGGLIQYSESDSKESSNKESNRKADNRESSNKEYNTKQGNREVSNKESDRKAQDRESDDKRDWNKQQDAEKGRKHDLQRTFDRINESESKRTARAQYLEQKMRASWPKIYDVVGHKLSEFPELLGTWNAARRIAVGKQTLTANNYAELFERAKSEFGHRVTLSLAARSRFTNAGFTVPQSYMAVFLASQGATNLPSLAGDSHYTTDLTLDYVANPAIGDNWRYALSADNLRLEFSDPEAAFEFLKSGQATGAQKR